MSEQTGEFLSQHPRPRFDFPVVEESIQKERTIANQRRQVEELEVLPLQFVDQPFRKKGRDITKEEFVREEIQKYIQALKHLRAGSAVLRAEVENDFIRYCSLHPDEVKSIITLFNNALRDEIQNPHVQTTLGLLQHPLKSDELVRFEGVQSMVTYIQGQKKAPLSKEQERALLLNATLDGRYKVDVVEVIFRADGDDRLVVDELNFVQVKSSEYGARKEEEAIRSHHRMLAGAMAGRDWMDERHFGEYKEKIAGMFFDVENILLELVTNLPITREKIFEAFHVPTDKPMVLSFILRSQGLLAKMEKFMASYKDALEQNEQDALEDAIRIVTRLIRSTPLVTNVRSVRSQIRVKDKPYGKDEILLFDHDPANVVLYH